VLKPTLASTIQMLDQLFRSNKTSTIQLGQTNMRLISVWANKRCLRGKYFPNDKVLKMVLRILEGTKQRVSFYRYMLSWTRGPSAPQKKGIMQKNCTICFNFTVYNNDLLSFVSFSTDSPSFSRHSILTHTEPAPIIFNVKHCLKTDTFAQTVYVHIYTCDVPASIWEN